MSKPKREPDVNEETEFWRSYRSEQQERRATRLPNRMLLWNQ